MAGLKYQGRRIGDVFYTLLWFPITSALGSLLCLSPHAVAAFFRQWLSPLIPSFGSLIEVRISGHTSNSVIQSLLFNLHFPPKIPMRIKVWEALSYRLSSSNPHKPTWRLLFPHFTEEATETQMGTITWLGQDHTTSYWQTKTCARSADSKGTALATSWRWPYRTRLLSLPQRMLCL